MGQRLGGDGMQPLSLSGDAKAGLVEAADRRLRRQGRDLRRHRRERGGLAARPIGHAVRAQTQRSEQIAHRFGGPILGNELMDVEIDRRRPDALSVLRRRSHSLGEGRPRHAAALFANVDGGLMLGHLDQPLGQIEHLSPLRAPLHRSRQPRAAMEARLRFTPHDPIRRLDLPERVALVSRLPAACLARAPAKASGNARLLPQPVARRRLGAVGTVHVQSSPKLGRLRPEHGVLASQRLILPANGRVLAPQDLVLGP
jgi:hypothetical protein